MADLGVKLKMADYLEMNEFFEEMINYHSHKGHKEKTQIYKDIRVALFGNDYLEENYNGHTRQ
tara:strand:- start:128 stop:316 length:189 start_codon:yes stop_codon:yes gene_type:complete